MRRLPIMVVLLAALAACKGSAPAQDKAAPSQAATATPAAGATAVARADPAVARSVEDKTPLYEFDYSYPAEAAAIPGLKAWLDADLDEQRQGIKDGALEGRDAAKDSGFPFNPYGHSTAWQVVASLPGWLSLSAQRWEFTGGAHGNPWSEALVWDKASGARLKPIDLFTSKAALTAAIQTPFCAEIDKQRAEKRGEPVNRDSGDPFSECIDPAQSTVILGSSDKQHFTRIGVLVDPYEAGPYAEGNYEVTLPVTAKVIAAVKPQYRAAFAVGR